MLVDYTENSITLLHSNGLCECVCVCFIFIFAKQAKTQHRTVERLTLAKTIIIKTTPTMQKLFIQRIEESNLKFSIKFALKFLSFNWGCVYE